MNIIQIKENNYIKKKKKFFSIISSITQRNTIAYYSGWLKKDGIPNTIIDEQDKNAFMATCYKLDYSKGLDLILHTPGGDIAATESIINYLKKMFNNDIRAIIPQISMSAGTMMAIACKTILMGKQSSLGPIDPQLGGIACQAVIDEFERAIKEIQEKPASLGLWQTIISKYHPTFLTACDNAINWSRDLAQEWLKEIYQQDINLDEFNNLFLNHKKSYSHSRHISREECKKVGLHIVDLEENQKLQDAILSLHHCYMIQFDKFPISKIVENHHLCQYNQNYSLG